VDKNEQKKNHRANHGSSSCSRQPTKMKTREPFHKYNDNLTAIVGMDLELVDNPNHAFSIFFSTNSFLLQYDCI
jgi:hypothetical protein